MLKLWSKFSKTVHVPLEFALSKQKIVHFPVCILFHCFKNLYASKNSKWSRRNTEWKWLKFCFFAFRRLSLPSLYYHGLFRSSCLNTGVCSVMGVRGTECPPKSASLIQNIGALWKWTCVAEVPRVGPSGWPKGSELMSMKNTMFIQGWAIKK